MKLNINYYMKKKICTNILMGLHSVYMVYFEHCGHQKIHQDFFLQYPVRPFTAVWWWQRWWSSTTDKIINETVSVKNVRYLLIYMLFLSLICISLSLKHGKSQLCHGLLFIISFINNACNSLNIYVIWTVQRRVPDYNSRQARL